MDATPDSPARQVVSTHVADVGAQRIARVYAQALLNAAGGSEEDAIIDELQGLIHEVFRQQPDFEEYLSSLAIGRDRKAAFLRQVFAERASPALLNFLEVLNKHDRLDLLRPILAAALELREKRRGQIHVIVQTAAALPDDQRERLTGELRAVFHREPVLEVHLDPDLLGGLTVRVGDWLYDASVRTQLRNIRKDLFESADHEIQSGRDRFSSAIGN